MKVLTFSRFYPAYHPKKGEPTYFVEKIWKHILDAEKSCYNPLAGYWERYDQAFQTTYSDHKENIHYHSPKGHTIRAGSRWKVGDFFSPRIWSGKPYQSKQIEFAPPIEVKKVWPIQIIQHTDIWNFYLDNLPWSQNRDNFNIDESVEMLAKNDGLSVPDFINWFQKTPKKIGTTGFTGQIICWNESIEY